MMKKYTLLIFLYTLSCQPPFDQKVERRSVTFLDKENRPYNAEIIVPNSKKPEGVIILVHHTMVARTAWRKTAIRMAVQRYVVINGMVREDADSSDGLTALTTTHLYLDEKYPGLKIGLLGADRHAMTCLQAGAVDSSLQGAVLLNPARLTTAADSLLFRAWRGRPLVLIASDRDPLCPQECSEQYYNQCHDPKKLVWLATEQRGDELLKTDLEPVIRRVTVLLFDRYLRGKNYSLTAVNKSGVVCKFYLCVSNTKPKKFGSFCFSYSPNSEF